MSLILKYDLGNPHRLPVGYTPLAYIESSGTLYIDPGSTFNSTSVRSFKLIFLDTIGNWVYGTNSSGPKEVLIGVRSYLGGGFDTPNLWKLNELYDVQISTITGAMYMRVNGETVRTSTGLANGFKEWLFADGKADNTINVCRKWRLYNYKIWDNNILVKNFIPAKNSSGVIGLFDCVSQTFFTNQGTGSFIAGPEVVVLPYEYLLVEYLEGTGTLWIDTNYLCNADNLLNLKYKLDAMATDTAVGNNWWACGIGGASGIGFHVGIGAGSSAKPFTFARGISDVNTGINGSLNTRYKWELDMVNLTYKVWSESGTSLVNTTFTRLTPTQSQNLALFRWRSYSNSGYIFGMKIYHMELYNTSSLVRNMIPCYRRSDLKPGMYDTVNNVFYTNSGSGEFVLGPVVEESSRQLEYNNAGSNYIGKPTNVHHSISNPSTTQINEGSGDFSSGGKIEVTIPSLGNSYSISWWANGTFSGSKMMWAIYPFNPLYNLCLNTGDGNNNPWYKPGTTTQITAPSSSVWHHFVITGDGSANKLYVDGVHYGTSKTYKSCTATVLRLNSYNGSASYLWNGKMYDFRLYNNVLTADEVLKIYKGGV